MVKSNKAQQVLARIRNIPVPYTQSYSGIDLVVTAEVYPTGELSDLVVECMRQENIGLQQGDCVLDYGTGTGFLAVMSAKLGAGKVIATDINPAAVECAALNVQRHDLGNIVEVRHGSCFESIGTDEKFDLILAGMPFEAADVESLLERSVYDPNFEMRTTLFQLAPQHLTERGRILTTYSDRVQQFQPIENFSPNFQYERVGQRVIKGELNFVYMLIPIKSRT